MTIVIMRVKNPPPGTHQSQEHADKQANPSVAYPGVYEITSGAVSGTTNHRIKQVWFDFAYLVNVLMGTVAGFLAALRNNAGWVNAAANPEWPAGSTLPFKSNDQQQITQYPDPLPIVEGVITIHNYVEVLEKFNQSARIKIFDYLQAPPDVSVVNPFTHPELFDLFRSVNKAGDLGYAPDGKKFYFPRLAKNGIGWLPLEILEPATLPINLEEPMALNKFPPINKGAFIHYRSQLFKDAAHPDGDMNKAFDFAQSLGIQTLAMKIGSGQVPWVGLEPWISGGRARGFTMLGWWYYWGYANEGEISGKHTAYLASFGLQGLLEDVEGEFDASLGTSGTLAARRKNLEPKARAIGAGLRKYNPNLPIALCGWREPKIRATPVHAFLEHCDANMPQVYSIGTGGPLPSVAADRINLAIAQYMELAPNFTGPTMPAVAAYHQDGNYVTVPQMHAVNARVQQLQLPGLIWWFLPHLIEKPEWAEEVKNHNWPVSYTSAPPVPEPEPLTDTQRIDRIEALMQVHGWL
jgi:hypothetical protein